MQIKKATAIFSGILLIAAGFVIGYLVNNSKLGNPEFNTSSYTTQFEKMEADSLVSIRDTVNAVLQQKDSITMDSLVQLGVIKDSLLEVAGKIKINLRIVKDAQIKHQLDSTLTVVNDLASECRRIIMKGAIELLRPTNVALRGLIKDIKERTEKLEKVAKTVATVSDVVSTLTNIISSPIFSAVSAPPATNTAQ